MVATAAAAAVMGESASLFSTYRDASPSVVSSPQRLSSPLFALQYRLWLVPEDVYFIAQGQHRRGFMSAIPAKQRAITTVQGSRC